MDDLTINETVQPDSVKVKLGPVNPAPVTHNNFRPTIYKTNEGYSNDATQDEI